MLINIYFTLLSKKIIKHRIYISFPFNSHDNKNSLDLGSGFPYTYHLAFCKHSACAWRWWYRYWFGKSEKLKLSSKYVGWKYINPNYGNVFVCDNFPTWLSIKRTVIFKGFTGISLPIYIHSDYTLSLLHAWV